MKIWSCLNILRFRLAIFLLEFSIFYLAKSKFNFVLNVILMIEINLSPSKPLRHLKFENDNLNFEKLWPILFKNVPKKFNVFQLKLANF